MCSATEPHTFDFEGRDQMMVAACDKTTHSDQGSGEKAFCGAAVDPFENTLRLNGRGYPPFYRSPYYT